MKAYTVVIELFVDYFEAESPFDAERVVNEYLDTLAEVAPANLSWPSCDFHIAEIEIAE